MPFSSSEIQKQLSRPHYHPEPELLGRQLSEVSRWLLQHFTTVPEQAIGLTASPRQMATSLGDLLPENGTDFENVFKEFQEKVVPFAFRINHPRFLAFVPSAPTFPSVLGDILCSGTNFFTGVWLEAAGPVQVELCVLEWFRRLLGLPDETCGLLTSGGSEATLTALLVARETIPFDDRSRAVLYVALDRHWSVDRAAKIMGLHTSQIRTVGIGENPRLNAGALQLAIDDDLAKKRLPWALVANAGATSTGAVDPLEELAGFCKARHLWLHVDAAYGWVAVLSSREKRWLAGIEKADSVTLDPHKWFGQTFETGCVLVREGNLLEETFRMRPDYLQDVDPGPEEVNFADRGIALTRRFRSLKIWFSVKMLGISWFRDLVDRCCLLAQYSNRLLENSVRFEILSPPELSIICFRYLPSQPLSHSDTDDLNRHLVQRLAETGIAFISSTRINNRIALRFCFVNWRTTAHDVEEVVKLLAALGEDLEKSLFTGRSKK